ncbi:MAG: hypothetical protein ACRCVT_15635 [Leadbetterella sp.]
MKKTIFVIGMLVSCQTIWAQRKYIASPKTTEAIASNKKFTENTDRSPKTWNVVGKNDEGLILENESKELIILQKDNTLSEFSSTNKYKEIEYKFKPQSLKLIGTKDDGQIIWEDETGKKYTLDITKGTKVEVTDYNSTRSNRDKGG